MQDPLLLEIVWNFRPNVIPGRDIPAWYGINVGPRFLYRFPDHQQNV